MPVTAWKFHSSYKNTLSLLTQRRVLSGLFIRNGAKVPKGALRSRITPVDVAGIMQLTSSYLVWAYATTMNVTTSNEPVKSRCIVS